VAFLLILYIKSSAEGNQSGGFNQEYYDASFKRGDKKAKVRALCLTGHIWRLCHASVASRSAGAASLI
jgi:hypothetical protein